MINEFDENDYINEQHIKAFKEALNYDDYSEDETLNRTDSWVSLLNGRPAKKVVGPETISSQSDWTPVFNKTRKRTNDEITSPTRDNTVDSETTDNLSTYSEKTTSGSSSYDEFSLTFTLLRYPLLAFIISWTTILSLLYFLVRISIALFENFVLSRDKQRSMLVKNLKESKSYEEYVENAKKLDKYLGLDQWCKEDRYKYYDWRNLKRTIHNLKRLRHAKKYEDLMIVLQTCVKSNYAGTENPLLYSHCYYGTKNLVEKYNSEVVKCLRIITETKSINLREKRIFFKIINKNFGRSCLVLSGGASFCYNHFGVIKALLENDLMPKIISGTSGGGMIAALVATRTNEELLSLINEKLATRIKPFGNEPMTTWIKRWWRTGARFDSIEWARQAQWWTKGSTSFEDSYKKTGKILNIATVPSDIHSPTILCNYITSPNCCIWSAMLASAAVPGILNPVMLMEKAKDNSIRPFSLGSKWKDGSLRTDVPLNTLNMYFNTKFSIVSQVNPHVMLWIFKNRGDIGKPIIRSKGKTFRGGFILSYLENLIKLEIIKWLKLVKEFQLFPTLLESDWSNLFLQNFGGTITLFPKIVLSDYFYILSDPTEERLAKIIKNGESVTYSKLLFIKHRLNIERTIEKGLEVSKVDIDSTATAPSNLVQNITELAEDTDSCRYKSEDVGLTSDDASDIEFSDDVDDSVTAHDLMPSDETTNLGFLGIRMGISPSENNDEKNSDEYYDSDNYKENQISN